MSHAELIARLEALTGSDREADEAIARLTGWSPTGGIPATGAPSHWYSTAFGMPAYTASLDAAVALVERVLPEWEWQAGDDAHFGKYGAVYQSRSEGGAGLSDDDMVSAATPPIGLLIATLRALQESSNDR